MKKILETIVCFFRFFYSPCKKEEYEIPFEELYAVNSTIVDKVDWDFANEILKEVNKYRKKKGLSAVNWGILTLKASAYATVHCEYMIEKKTISHDNYTHRQLALKYWGARQVAEVVGYGYDTAKKVVKAWSKSAEHEKIMSGSYHHCGIGILKDSNGANFITQIYYNL